MGELSKTSRGRESANGSVGKVLASQSWWHEFSPQNPIKVKEKNQVYVVVLYMFHIFYMCHSMCALTHIHRICTCTHTTLTNTYIILIIFKCFEMKLWNSPWQTERGWEWTSDHTVTFHHWKHVCDHHLSCFHSSGRGENCGPLFPCHKVCKCCLPPLPMLCHLSLSVKLKHSLEPPVV